MMKKLYVTPEEFDLIARLAREANDEDAAKGYPQGAAVTDGEDRPAALRFIEHMRDVHGCVEGNDYETVVQRTATPRDLQRAIAALSRDEVI